MNKYPSPVIMTAYTFACITVGILIMYFGEKYDNRFSPPRVPVPAALAEPGHTFEDLLDAIEWVESKGDPWAVGDNGNAVGAYQIHKIYVDDVKRIERRKKGWGILDAFEYADRTDKGLSRKMVTIYLKHYGGTFEEMAAKHVAGPNGHTQMDEPAVKEYVEKVMGRMNNLR